MLANVAELGAERMEATIGKASLRDAAIGTGIAVDKMLALTGQTPAVQIANITLPTTRNAPSVGGFTIGWTLSHEGSMESREPAPSSRHTRRHFSEPAASISLAVADRRVIPIRA